MEWIFWIVIVVMLGLYVWSHVSAGHRIGRKLRPFVDELFGVTPLGKSESKDNPPVTRSSLTDVHIVKRRVDGEPCIVRGAIRRKHIYGKRIVWVHGRFRIR
jgi:hypothetical protein